MEGVRKKKRVSTNATITDVPIEVLERILRLAGTENEENIKNEHVNRRWKSALNRRCYGKCDIEKHLFDGLVRQEKGAISHLLKHGDLSDNVVTELIISGSTDKYTPINLEGVTKNRGHRLLNHACSKGYVNAARRLILAGVVPSIQTLLEAAIWFQRTENADVLAMILDIASSTCDLYLDEKIHSVISRTVSAVIVSKDLFDYLSKFYAASTFMYLFKRIPETLTSYSYEKALLSAIHTKDEDFCTFLCTRHSEFLPSLSYGCILRIIRLHQNYTLLQVLVNSHNWVMPAIMYSISEKDSNCFKVSLAVLITHIFPTLDSTERSSRIKCILNRCLSWRCDYILSILLKIENISSMFSRSHVKKLLRHVTKFTLHKSLEAIIHVIKSRDHCILPFLDIELKKAVSTFMSMGNFDVVATIINIGNIRLSKECVLDMCEELRENKENEGWDTLSDALKKHGVLKALCL